VYFELTEATRCFKLGTLLDFVSCESCSTVCTPESCRSEPSRRSFSFRGRQNPRRRYLEAYFDRYDEIDRLARSSLDEVGSSLSSQSRRYRLPTPSYKGRALGTYLTGSENPLHTSKPLLILDQLSFTS